MTAANGFNVGFVLAMKRAGKAPAGDLDAD
jgi:hypothetical protein